MHAGPSVSSLFCVVRAGAEFVQKDIMPLVDNSEFKEHNEGVDDVVEVVVAVMVPPEVRVLQLLISTVKFRTFTIARKFDQSLKRLHSNDGKYVIKHLQTNWKGKMLLNSTGIQIFSSSEDS